MIFFTFWLCETITWAVFLFPYITDRFFLSLVDLMGWIFPVLAKAIFPPKQKKGASTVGTPFSPFPTYENKVFFQGFRHHRRRHRQTFPPSPACCIGETPPFPPPPIRRQVLCFFPLCLYPEPTLPYCFKGGVMACSVFFSSPSRRTDKTSPGRLVSRRTRNESQPLIAVRHERTIQS